MRRLLLFLCPLLILWNDTKLQGQKNDFRKQVERIIKYDSDLDFDLTPSFLVGMVDHTHNQIEVFGNKFANYEKLDSLSVFELGSISKVISSEILFSMVDEKMLSLSSELNDLIPDEYYNPRMKGVTLEHIFKFESKLPHVFKGKGLYENDPRNPYEYFSKTNLLEFYKNYIPEADLIGNSYSDTDFALLEIILERSSAKTFEDLIQHYINDKIGTKFFTSAHEQKESVVASGMNRSGLEGEPLVFQSFAASEGIKGSIKDVLTLMQYLIAKNQDKIETKEQFKSKPETWTSRIRGFEGLYVIDAGKSSYPFVSNGLTNIHHSFIGFLPRTQTAVVVLANSATGTKDLGLLTLRMINNNWKRKN
ncbi:MAG: beta-lactamase family protein [Saprospiraceae bacterium]|nr:beta-lactamase family protein [Saprospiraceae bacterium]